MLFTEKSMQTRRTKKCSKNTSPFITDTEQCKKNKAREPNFCIKQKHVPRKHPKGCKNSLSDTQANGAGGNYIM